MFSFKVPILDVSILNFMYSRHWNYGLTPSCYIGQRQVTLFSRTFVYAFIFNTLSMDHWVAVIVELLGSGLLRYVHLRQLNKRKTRCSTCGRVPGFHFYLQFCVKTKKIMYIFVLPRRLVSDGFIDLAQVME